MSSHATKSLLLIALFLASCVLSSLVATRQVGQIAAQATASEQLADIGEAGVEGVIDFSALGDGDCAKPMKLKGDQPVGVDEILEPRHLIDENLAGLPHAPPCHGGAQAPCARIDFELRPPIA